MTIYEYFDTFTTDDAYGEAVTRAWELYQDDYDAFTAWAEREGIDLTARSSTGDLMVIQWAWECEEW